MIDVDHKKHADLFPYDSIFGDYLGAAVLRWRGLRLMLRHSRGWDRMVHKSFVGGVSIYQGSNHIGMIKPGESFEFDGGKITSIPTGSSDYARLSFGSFCFGLVRFDLS